MPLIENLRTGLIYRNPAPHVRSVHAYFPSVAVLPDGEMLATAVLGEAFEAVNLHTHLFRSVDQGETWRHTATADLRLRAPHGAARRRAGGVHDPP